MFRGHTTPSVLNSILNSAVDSTEIILGTVFQVSRCRRETSKIKLLVKGDKGKLKVEDWPITGTVAQSPHK